MKTKLVLEGKSKAEIVVATSSAIGQEGTAAAGAGSDVLHAVKAAISKRRGHELASASDVFCLGDAARAGAPICSGFADYVGERPSGTGNDLPGLGRQMV